MAFKQVCSSLFVAVACCSVLSMATPLSYLRDNDQSGLPFQNQGNQGFVYLRDNGANQVPAVVQNRPVNYVNNIVGTSQVQTIASYPNAISNVELVQYPTNVLSSNIVNNVNSVNTLNGLSTVQYSAIAQTVPVNQIVSYPSVQQTIPVNQYVSSPIVQSIPQYAAVQQPAYISGPVGYQNSYPNQVTNNQVTPVEVNIGSGPGYGYSNC